MGGKLPSNHEEWLAKHGVRVDNITQQHRAYIEPLRLSELSEEWSPVKTITDRVYHARLPENVLSEWQHTETRLHRILDLSNKVQNRTLDVNIIIEAHKRHRFLLETNSMYKDAWSEFQTIRALLGEDTHRPY